MANIKSAQKRISVSNKKALQNQMIVSRMKTYIKKFNAAINSGNIELSESLLPQTISIVDGACAKGCIHKNNADRKKALFTYKVAALKSGTLVITKKAERKVKEKKEVVLVPRAEKLAQKQAEKDAALKAEKEAKKAAKTLRPAKTEVKAEKKAEKPAKAEKSAAEPKAKVEPKAKAEPKAKKEKTE